MQISFHFEVRSRGSICGNLCIHSSLFPRLHSTISYVIYIFRVECVGCSLGVWGIALKIFNWWFGVVLDAEMRANTWDGWVSGGRKFEGAILARNRTVNHKKAYFSISLLSRLSKLPFQSSLDLLTRWCNT